MTLASLHRIERLNYLLGGVLVLAMVFVMDSEGALGVLVGVVLSSINFTVMRRMVQAWSRRPPSQRGPSSFFMVPKMILLMGAIVLSLMLLPISAVGLAVGFSVFLVSIAVETVRYISTPQPAGEETTGADEGKK
jgi:hypothetical protein